jgi:hypothetical protein
VLFSFGGKRLFRRDSFIAFESTIPFSPWAGVRGRSCGAHAFVCGLKVVMSELAKASSAMSLLFLPSHCTAILHIHDQSAQRQGDRWFKQRQKVVLCIACSATYLHCSPPVLFSDSPQSAVIMMMMRQGDLSCFFLLLSYLFFKSSQKRLLLSAHLHQH